MGSGQRSPARLPWRPLRKTFFGHVFQKRTWFSSDYFFEFRDRLLASQKFQSFSAKFWLTRWIARREARALFDICAGFVYAQTLAACIELDLFGMLASEPMAAAMLAARCQVPAARLRILLDAAVSLRLLAMSGQTYRLGTLGAALRGNPGIAAMVEHHRMFYADVAEPVALLRGLRETRLSTFWPYAGHAGDAAAYSALMAASQPMVAQQIFSAYDFSRHDCVLDVGGGDGSFLCRLAARAPGIRMQLFDLGAVAEQAGQKFAAAGLAGRATVFAGDFARDALPRGADVATLVRVLHDHDDVKALTILQAVYAALPKGGVVVVAEPMAGTKGAGPVGAAYFGFYLLAIGSGRPRRYAEIEALLLAAGFDRVKRLSPGQPMLAGVAVAYVP